MTKNFTFKSLKTTIPKFKIGSNGLKIEFIGIHVC